MALSLSCRHLGASCLSCRAKLSEPRGKQVLGRDAVRSRARSEVKKTKCREPRQAPVPVASTWPEDLPLRNGALGLLWSYSIRV